MSTQDKQELTKVWEAALRKIKEEVPASGFQAWVKTAHLAKAEPEDVVLEVRNEFSRNLITQNYFRSIQKGIEDALRQPINLRLEVNSQLPGDDGSYVPSLASLAQAPGNGNGQLAAGNGNPDATHQMGLNEKFRFDNFVVGAHNQFCHAAALSIAENPLGGVYNPFFIYGGVGLGKTHIMHAIGNHVQKRNPAYSIMYLTAERFLNDMLDCMRRGKMKEFRERYRSAKMLLLDDIQFIEGKEMTQEEFFHTFNALRDHGSQIVLTSDRPPDAIPKLEPRLCSRFKGGLIADVQAPTYETRLAIVARKSEDLRLKLESAVMDVIAQSFPGNVRVLEGALLKLMASVNFTGREATVELTKQVLGITDRSEASQALTAPVPGVAPSGNRHDALEELISEVCRCFGVSQEALRGRENTMLVRRARQTCMYMCRKLNLATLQALGRLFDRGNSSVINACKQIEVARAQDLQLDRVCEQLERKFGELASSSE